MDRDDGNDGRGLFINDVIPFGSYSDPPCPLVIMSSFGYPPHPSFVRVFGWKNCFATKQHNDDCLFSLSNDNVDTSDDDKEEMDHENDNDLQLHVIIKIIKTCSST